MLNNAQIEQQTYSTLQKILDEYRNASQTNRDFGTLFEDFMKIYFRYEPKFKNQYESVQTYKEWASEQKDHLDLPNVKDTGIDLVATTFTGEFHAIQCKNYEITHRMTQSDIDGFLANSSKTYFKHRIVVSTVVEWTQNADLMLQNQIIPVTTINLHDLNESSIDWNYFYDKKRVRYIEKKTLMEHQREALENTRSFFKSADRGKLLMACGTGKTFTSLKIAESVAGKGKMVLFLVPSLALLNQTLNEWTQQSNLDLLNFAVCSDSDIGKHSKIRKAKINDDVVIATMSDLEFPATTNAKSLAEKIHKLHNNNYMTVIYATYQSLDVIKTAQKEHGLANFDLIVCDEAHRTAGFTLKNEEDSSFVRVHYNENVNGSKRLYMTATPTIYADKNKKVKEGEAPEIKLYSMDNEEIFGRDFYVLNFSDAVEKGLLVDYKVIVLAIEESQITRQLETVLDKDNQLKVNDAAKIVGCWKAIAKEGLFNETDKNPMKRAVAFCQVIDPTPNAKSHQVSSRVISQVFQEVVTEYQKIEADKILAKNPDAELPNSLSVVCKSEHIDGMMSASEKQGKIDWLKQPIEDNTCHILSNVRCLSEGVDVPSLDAVIFMTPRQSQVDVVQSVGRVMRKAEGKTTGYVILPVVIPTGVEPDVALNDNDTYKVVWQVLNALRSHDDSFDDVVNKLNYTGGNKKMEVIALRDEKNITKRKKTKTTKAKQSNSIGKKGYTPDQLALSLSESNDIERAIYSMIVRKVGNRQHWDNWVSDIAKIANTHIDRITSIVNNPNNTIENATFNSFLSDLHRDLNENITRDEAIEMLAQHIITKPVFDALFDEYNFTKHNPISIAMQKVLDVLEAKNLSKEVDTLQSFYRSIQNKASGITDIKDKQSIIKELYDKFFRKAFPKMSERLGIVYTPIEIVDFIIHSIENVLKDEFGASLADKGVHILDPFTGTGSFVTRLLESGIIPDNQLSYKYTNEIHANEIVLLAYYIACINIEAVYHSMIIDEYTPFEGICLTDTFELHNEPSDNQTTQDNTNHQRLQRQKKLDIRVIMGNPPYSAGQKNENDNNANNSYPMLDKRITDTYAHSSTASNTKNLMDSYVRAIRWASDRVQEKGVIGFVTNASYIHGNAMDGLRKCLVNEFSSLYVFNLRGNSRTSGDVAKKEGGNVFDVRVPIAIMILVKNPTAKEFGVVNYYDIGDNLSKLHKLSSIVELHDLHGISQTQSWQRIQPNQFGDWIAQRDINFDKYLTIGDKKDKNSVVLFDLYSLGLGTNRDLWVYNYSKKSLKENLQVTINFFNNEIDRYNTHESKITNLNDFISIDSTRISWSSSLIPKVAKNIKLEYQILNLRTSLYRPFDKQNVYFDNMLNHRVGQIPKIFPTANSDNLAICTTVTGNKGFSVLIADYIPDLHLIGDSQCFPLYLYEQNEQGEYIRKDAITDDGLKHFTDFYASQMNSNDQITKEDIFYYVYGLLHSEDYRQKYADNLSKQLPRIPRTKTYQDFIAFSQAGRKLADLHINYETVDMYMGCNIVSDQTNLKLAASQQWAKSSIDDGVFYVRKMKHPSKANEQTKKAEKDLTKLIYNDHITLENIPLKCYNYIVNGKPAIEWVIERQAVTTDKDSGIVNDANDWALETMKNARYPLELILRVITVSLKTQEIVENLPNLDIE